MQVHSLCIRVGMYPRYKGNQEKGWLLSYLRWEVMSVLILFWKQWKVINFRVGFRPRQKLDNTVQFVVLGRRGKAQYFWMLLFLYERAADQLCGNQFTCALHHQHRYVVLNPICLAEFSHWRSGLEDDARKWSTQLSSASVLKQFALKASAR